MVTIHFISTSDGKQTKHEEKIKHHHDPTKPGWQKKLVDSLSDMGVQVDPEKVLSKVDYSAYKHHFGIGAGRLRSGSRRRSYKRGRWY